LENEFYFKHLISWVDLESLLYIDQFSYNPFTFKHSGKFVKIKCGSTPPEQNVIFMNYLIAN